MTARSLVPGLLLSGLALAVVPGSVSAADAIVLEGDGWHAWTTAATPQNRQRCCFDWRGGRPSPRCCDLDSKQRSISNSDAHPGPVSDVRLYVLVEDDEVSRITALGPDCPVATNTPVRELGRISPQDSANWLLSQVGSSKWQSSDALASLSLLGQGQAFKSLRGLVESGADEDLRAEALFWLVQSDTDEAFEYLDRLLSRR